MLNSKVDFSKGNPLININGKLHPPLAYTTYFDECGDWRNFIKSGYRMFFVNVSFTDLPINNVSGFTPFRTGVFETETPDYSDFDNMVHGILSECPDAFIFPRIQAAMPRKWIKENPDETVITPSGARESLFSDAYKRDCAELLEVLVDHIRTSDYAHRIAGYQLCGGTTQEWIHHDLSGSFSQSGNRKFEEWAYKNYGVHLNAPRKEDFVTGACSEAYRKYCRFCCEQTAETIEYLAKALKNFINGEQIVGVFYGYSAFVSDPLWGLHGLGKIIDSPCIDFFSSPCCYDDNRNLGLDWGDMIPVDSVKLHGKLCFIECDIRTHLTQRMQASRPDEYPEDIMPTVNSDGSKTVWKGPETLPLSLSAIRKAFAHQLAKSSGIWWFDMWGGWYRSDEIMAEIEKMHEIFRGEKSGNTSNLPAAEAVVFIDEKAFSDIPRGSHLCHTASAIRVAMGSTGIPFDLYMIEDACKVLKNYRAAVFTAPVLSESGKTALEECIRLGIPFISSSEEKPFISTAELREFLVASGVHCYNPDGCVVYCSQNILGIHTVSDGETKVTLPKKYKITSLFAAETAEYEGDEITFTAPKHSTEIFSLSAI